MGTIWLELFQQQRGSKYWRICSAVVEAIEQGILKAGEQLPPQRDLADMLGVTLGTVSRGYREAEKRGMVIGETGRGTFVRNPENERYSLHFRHNVPQELRAPIPFDLNFPMDEGQPDLARTLRDLSNRPNISELLRYQPAAGMVAHREAGAQWLANFGVQVETEQVFITAGGQHAIHTVLQLQGAETGAVGVERLTYPGVINTATFLGGSLLAIGMDQEGMIPEELDGACRRHRLAGIYLMPSVQNPTAARMGEERRRAIVEVARLHDLFIVEDEVYAPLQQEYLLPIRELAPERTFYFSGLSKVLAPGLRIAYLVIPEGMQRSAAAAVSSSIWMAPPLMAELASQWIEDGTLAEVIAAKRRAAIRRLAILRDHLAGARLRTLDGALHAWLELPGQWRAELFVKEAALQGVDVLPASGFSPDRQVEGEAVRICFGAPAHDAQVMEGAMILNGLLKERPAPVPALM